MCHNIINQIICYSELVVRAFDICWHYRMFGTSKGRKLFVSQLGFDVSFYKTYFGFALCDVLAFYVSCYTVYFRLVRKSTENRETVCLIDRN